MILQQPLHFKVSRQLSFNNDTPHGNTLPNILGPAFSLEPAVGSSHPLQQDAIDELNLSMNTIVWLERFERAGDDLKKREKVFAQILLEASFEASSELNFVEIHSRSNAEKLIQSLDEKGLKEWQDGVKAGIQKRD